jgi:hypothetical protein
MSTPPSTAEFVVLLGLEPGATAEDVISVIYDTRGCCLIAAESIRAVIAAINAMEDRVLRRVAARLDTSVTRNIAVARASYKRPVGER